MQADRERGVGYLFCPATGTPIRAMGPVTWSLMMLLFQSLHAEEGLAATATVREAEVPASTAGEAEASIVPTGGPAFSLFTEDMGEGVTLVSSSEHMLFPGEVGISGGCSHWSSLSVCRMQGDGLVGSSLSRH